VLVGGDGEAAARRAGALGPTEVVVKRGALGAAVLDPDGTWHVMPAPARIEIDPVGAGDAFNAGYLAARLAGASCLDALRAGCDAGATAAGTFGDVSSPAATRRAIDV
jgi:2-dehydro-3-deoxygluconokinase